MEGFVTFPKKGSILPLAEIPSDYKLELVES